MPAQPAWGQAFKWSLGNWRISILLLVPAAVVLKMLHHHPVAIFGAAALALVPLASLLGDAAGHSTAVTMARKNKMDLALNIAVGSSTQIALFVAPLLVIVSQLMPSAMSLVFHPLEIAAVILSVGVVTLVSQDGETNWFEGLQLLSVYVILGAFFYFLPS
jgi:Ca2+:H+ antiporter